MIFTPEEVTNLNQYQRCGIYHPFTCGSEDRYDDKHDGQGGLLVATVKGWICPYCDYVQDWAHDFMKKFDEESARTILSNMINTIKGNEDGEQTTND